MTVSHHRKAYVSRAGDQWVTVLSGCHIASRCIYLTHRHGGLLSGFFGHLPISNPIVRTEKRTRDETIMHNITRPSVANWGGGMSVCCTVGPIVRYRGQWMAA